jgi:hypothetical protein
MACVLALAPCPLLAGKSVSSGLPRGLPSRALSSTGSDGLLVGFLRLNAVIESASLIGWLRRRDDEIDASELSPGGR